MTATPKPLLRWWRARMDLLAGLVIFVLVQLLIGQWRSAVLGPAVAGAVDSPPSVVEIIGYWVTAGLTLGLLVLGFAVAASQRRFAAMVVYPIVGVIAVGTVLLLAVPQIGLPAEPEFQPKPGVCYLTDSENCLGG